MILTITKKPADNSGMVIGTGKKVADAVPIVQTIQVPADAVVVADSSWRAYRCDVEDKVLHIGASALVTIGTTLAASTIASKRLGASVGVSALVGGVLGQIAGSVVLGVLNYYRGRTC